jgi:hypothetical protein
MISLSKLLQIATAIVTFVAGVPPATVVLD